jgi:hypothetical protein
VITSTLASLTIPAGAKNGSLSVDVSQFGMSGVQSLLVDNENNDAAITVTTGQVGVPFGIQAGGMRVIPVFQKGTLLNIRMTLVNVSAIPVSLAFRIFNTIISPAASNAQV